MLLRRKKRAAAAPRIAIVGRPNVGKSSIVNALMSAEQRSTAPRLISPVPGTTRDATDTVIRSHGKEYVFIDTAGLRKQARVERGLELFSVLRTLQALESADVTILVLDATEGTGLILVVNKMDMLDTEAKEKLRKHVAHSFAFCRWAPVLFTSAKTRDELPHLFTLIQAVSDNRGRRITTNVLNRLFQDLSQKHQSVSGGKIPFKNVTQGSVYPPTFAIFIKDPRRLHFSALRFMERKLRELYPFDGTPVRWLKKSRAQED